MLYVLFKKYILIVAYIANVDKIWDLNFQDTLLMFLVDYLSDCESFQFEFNLHDKI